MSRLFFSLKSKNKKLKIPFNYNHVLAAIIYNKINDLDLSYELHRLKSFKFFTFSQLNISKRNLIKNGFISNNGRFSFQFSSPDDYLIKSLVEGFLEDTHVKFINENLYVDEISIINEPDFLNTMSFKTISPIIVRKKKEIGGKLKIWDLNPCDEFFKSLENNLIKKYKIYNSIDSTKKNITIFSEMNSVKRKRIAIKKGIYTSYHRCYMMDLICEGDIDLIKFAYDCGLGEKNSLGFGMIEDIKK